MTRIALVAGALALLGCSDDTSKGTDTSARGDAKKSGEPGRTADHRPPPACASVTIAFAGQVVTVAKTPLGLDSSLRTTAVTGELGYKPCSIDSRPADAKRGLYDQLGSGDFTLTMGGKSITGSGNPIVEVENLDPDTFRWSDGPSAVDPDKLLRQMKVDGTFAPTLRVLFSITDSSGKAFSSDALPSSFPLLDVAGQHYPHTFSVEDEGGTALLQLSSMTQK